ARRRCPTACSPRCRSARATSSSGSSRCCAPTRCRRPRRPSSCTLRRWRRSPRSPSRRPRRRSSRTCAARSWRTCARGPTSGRRLAARLQRHGTVGLSSFYADPGELARAMQEAELVLDVLKASDAPIAEDIGTGTYRLLFRVLASHPEEVRSFYEDTVAPIVKYDDQYRTDLVGTLEAYLEQNCNMNATAAAIYAHRHTVAYRLERVREL